MLNVNVRHFGLSLSKDLYLVITQKLIFLEKLDFMWNPPDFINPVWNLPDFTVRSTWKPYKSNNSRKTLQFHGVQGKAMSYDFTWSPPNFMKSTTKDQQLLGMVRHMFMKFMTLTNKGPYGPELICHFANKFLYEKFWDTLCVWLFVLCVYVCLSLCVSLYKCECVCVLKEELKFVFFSKN